MNAFPRPFLWRGGQGALKDRRLGAGPRAPPSTLPVAPPGPSEAVLIFLRPLLGTRPRQHFPLASLRMPCSSPARGLVLIVPPLRLPKLRLPPTCSRRPTTSSKPALGGGTHPCSSPQGACLSGSVQGLWRRQLTLTKSQPLCSRCSLMSFSHQPWTDVYRGPS